MLKFKGKEVRVGVDIIEIARIKRDIEKWGLRFLKRIYTEKELLFCENRIPELAVRFAGKEAVSKLLGTGLLGKSPLKWQEIEILPNSYGKPELYLYGEAEKRAREECIRDIDITFSHSRDLALAFVGALLEK